MTDESRQEHLAGGGMWGGGAEKLDVISGAQLLEVLLSNKLNQ